MADYSAPMLDLDRDLFGDIGAKRLRFNISRNSEAQVIFTGEVTQEAIEKLAALLALQKDTFPTQAELDESETERILEKAE